VSLIKKPELTQKQVAAIRPNQELSHGQVTAEGRERIRAGHRHAPLRRKMRDFNFRQVARLTSLLMMIRHVPKMETPEKVAN
jgi:hypothetical protein